MPSTPAETVYESTPRNSKFEIDDDEVDDYGVEEDVSDFGRKNFGKLASPYLTPYIYNRFLDTQYGIRREKDGRYMIRYSTLSVDNTTEISIKGHGLWELLTRKNVNRGVMTTDDLKRYKTILQLNSDHLQGYEPGSNVQTSRGPKFWDVISKFFPQTKRPRGVEVALWQHCERYGRHTSWLESCT